MTVLLIDAGGNVREWEIRELVGTLLVALPGTMSARRVPPDEPIRPVSLPVVRFDLSDELSYPRVYRFVKVNL